MAWVAGCLVKVEFTSLMLIDSNYNLWLRPHQQIEWNSLLGRGIVRLLVVCESPWITLTNLPVNDQWVKLIHDCVRY